MSTHPTNASRFPEGDGATAEAAGGQTAAEAHYYAAASSWDAEVIRSARVARNRAYLFAAISWIVTIMATVAMSVVFMREKIEVVTIAYDEAAQTVRHVRYNVADAQRLTGMDAVRKFHLNQWVTALETWSYADSRRRGRTLQLLAAPSMESKLITMVQGSEQDRALGQKLERAVKVQSMSLLKDGVAHVQFQTEDFVEGNSIGVTDWAAVVEFRFTHKPSERDELLNPFGFQVTNYRRDAATVR